MFLFPLGVRHLLKSTAEIQKVAVNALVACVVLFTNNKFRTKTDLVFEKMFFPFLPAADGRRPLSLKHVFLAFFVLMSTSSSIVCRKDVHSSLESFRLFRILPFIDNWNSRVADYGPQQSMVTSEVCVHFAFCLQALNDGWAPYQSRHVLFVQMAQPHMSQ